MIILLMDDLVDCCKPGDDVTILYVNSCHGDSFVNLFSRGVVMRRWWPVKLVMIVMVTMVIVALLGRMNVLIWNCCCLATMLMFIMNRGAV